MLKKSFVMNKNCHSAKVTGRRARKVEGAVFFVSMSRLKVGVQCFLMTVSATPFTLFEPPVMAVDIPA